MTLVRSNMFANVHGKDCFSLSFSLSKPWNEIGLLVGFFLSLPRSGHWNYPASSSPGSLIRRSPGGIFKLCSRLPLSLSPLLRDGSSAEPAERNSCSHPDEEEREAEEVTSTGHRHVNNGVALSSIDGEMEYAGLEITGLFLFLSLSLSLNTVLGRSRCSKKNMRGKAVRQIHLRCTALRVLQRYFLTCSMHGQ